MTTAIIDPTDRDFDATLEVNPKNDVGFFGGIKLGYVFGTGVVRPTVEGDFFYNGFRGGADFTLRDRFDDVIGQRNVTTWINTGSFMANFILRFAPGNQKFQPYAGAGVGVYYAESAGVEVQDPVTGRVPINTGGGASHADLAWQIIAGSDYYFNPKMSAFIEYKFLEYTSTQINTEAESCSGTTITRRGCSLPLLGDRSLSRGGRRTQNEAVTKIAAEALAMLVFQTVVKAGFLVSFSKDNGLAVSNCRRRADESGKRIQKRDCSSWRRSDIAGRLCRASYETVHHYESIHFDQLDR